MPSQFETLEQSVRDCRHCAERFAQTATAHAPNPILQVSRKARLCVAGQAPGLRAHDAGKPFADPSGIRLRDWMGIGEDIFYDASKVAVLPMAFCFPGYNAKGADLPPPRDCAKLWRKKLFAQLPQIELILLVGKSALNWHLPALSSQRMEQIVRLGPHDAMDSGTESSRLFPLPHPSWRNNAWLKKNSWFETDILPILRAEVARLVA